MLSKIAIAASYATPTFPKSSYMTLKLVDYGIHWSPEEKKLVCMHCGQKTSLQTNGEDPIIYHLHQNPLCSGRRASMTGRAFSAVTGSACPQPVQSRPSTLRSTSEATNTDITDQGSERLASSSRTLDYGSPSESQAHIQNKKPNLIQTDRSHRINKAEDEASLRCQIEELSRMNQELKERKLCKVCMEEEINVVILRCGHRVCCTECVVKIYTCPYCREVIRGTVRILPPIEPRKHAEVRNCVESKSSNAPVNSTLPAKSASTRSLPLTSITRNQLPADPVVVNRSSSNILKAAGSTGSLPATEKKQQQPPRANTSSASDTSSARNTSRERNTSSARDTSLARNTSRERNTSSARNTNSARDTSLARNSAKDTKSPNRRNQGKLQKQDCKQSDDPTSQSAKSSTKKNPQFKQDQQQQQQQQKDVLEAQNSHVHGNVSAREKGNRKKKKKQKQQMKRPPGQEYSRTELRVS